MFKSKSNGRIGRRIDYTIAPQGPEIKKKKDLRIFDFSRTFIIAALVLIVFLSVFILTGGSDSFLLRGFGPDSGLSCAPRYDLPVTVRSKVSTGLEVFLSGDVVKYKGKKIALVTNQSGLDSSLAANADLLERQGVIVDRILAPEHGLFGFSDWPESVSAEKDVPSKRKIIHIQDMSAVALRKSIAGCDAVMYDIQDLGMRCYTYIAELSCVIDALDRSNTELVVLDRPNPLIVFGVDGFMLNPAVKSGKTGFFPAPMMYGLTAGESALYYARSTGKKVRLTVIKMNGYLRDLYFSETSLPWIPPSPNLPSYKSAFLYSAAVYLEGANLSVGRGTPNPFEYFGAPWIDAPSLASSLNKLNIRGFAFRPVYFKPAAALYKGTRCGGVQIFLTGEKFSPVENAYRILSFLKGRYPEFSWYRDAKGIFGIDVLSGNSLFRKNIDGQIPFSETAKEISKTQEPFVLKMKEFYLY
jgi:uncharacterized protein YbbC (DUF1343 family)